VTVFLGIDGKIVVLSTLRSSFFYIDDRNLSLEGPASMLKTLAARMPQKEVDLDVYGVMMVRIERK